MLTFMGQMAQTLTPLLYNACPSPQDTGGGHNLLTDTGDEKLLQLLESI